MNPEAVKRYFGTKGVNAEIYHAPANMDSLIDNSKASILMYAHESGAHYVAVEKAGGMYNVYNEYGKDQGPRSYSSMNELNQGNFTAISLITLS